MNESYKIQRLLDLYQNNIDKVYEELKNTTDIFMQDFYITRQSYNENISSGIVNAAYSSLSTQEIEEEEDVKLKEVIKEFERQGIQLKLTVKGKQVDKQILFYGIVLIIFSESSSWYLSKSFIKNFNYEGISKIIINYKRNGKSISKNRRKILIDLIKETEYNGSADYLAKMVLSELKIVLEDILKGEENE